jgi:hypothetical protein
MEGDDEPVADAIARAIDILHDEMLHGYLYNTRVGPRLGSVADRAIGGIGDCERIHGLLDEAKKHCDELRSIHRQVQDWLIGIRGDVKSRIDELRERFRTGDRVRIVGYYMKHSGREGTVYAVAVEGGIDWVNVDFPDGSRTSYTVENVKRIEEVKTNYGKEKNKD